MKNNILIGAAVVVVAVVLFFTNTREKPQEIVVENTPVEEATTTPALPDEVVSVVSEPAPATPVFAACTKELLICPDGTGVGRTGPKCAFAPCPGTEISGTMKKDEEGFYIENLGKSIRLVFGAGDLILPFYGKVVRALGAYSEGDIFRAKTIEKYDLTRGSLSMGQSKIIGGVSVMLQSVEDSRCPIDTTCDEPENFVAHLQVRNDSGTENIILSYENGHASFDNHEVSLVDIYPPFVREGQELSQSDYQVTVSVKK